MTTEERLQLLEQEMQLLKNQIQAVLLDIQDQLLTNAYPSLRTSGGPSLTQEISIHTGGAPTPIRSFGVNANELTYDPDIAQNSKLLEWQKQRAEQPSEQLSAQLPAGLALEPSSRRVSKMDESDQLEAPATSELALSVRSNNKRATNNHKVVEPEPDEFEDENDASDDYEEKLTKVRHLNWHTLESWVNKRLQKLGPARTRTLIRQYTARGRFTSGIQSALLELVDDWAADDEPDTEPDQPTRTKPPIITIQADTDEEDLLPQEAEIISALQRLDLGQPPASIVVDVPSKTPANQKIVDADDDRRDVVVKLIDGLHGMKKATKPTRRSHNG
ncbi:MAG: hypothetical protein U0528_05810 [Anaerolineae bacterium]